MCAPNSRRVHGDFRPRPTRRSGLKAQLACVGHRQYDLGDHDGRATSTAELIKHGLAAASPAITVADAAMPSQQSVQGTLADIAALTKEADIKPPAITVIGAVAGFRPTPPTRESIEPRTS